MPLTLFRIGAIPHNEATPLFLGPKHPSRAGQALLRVELAAGIVTSADFQPGYLHRGAEKLFEARDYRSALMLANRHDWLAAFSGELSVALTVESAMHLTPPTRATWLRTLFAEFARTHSHLSYLSYLPFRFDDAAATTRVDNARHRIREFFGDLSGNRVHPMLTRLGGMAHDLTPNLLSNVQDALAHARSAASSLRGLIEDCGSTLCGIGTLAKDDVLGYGLSGPVSAASGVRLDTRDTGYLAYGALPQRPDCTRTDGDARSRFEALVGDLEHSIVLIEHCLEALPDGPISVKLAKIVKVPEGTYYGEVAAPWGTAGVHLVSRGDRTPWRLGLRTPTFANCSALPAALMGCPRDKIGDVVASLGYGVGDLDR